MEIIAKNTAVYGKNCVGCKRHDRDIMIGIKDANDGKIHDVFLDNIQAESLIQQLQERLDQNVE